jgi:hypothetical protein
VDSEDAVAAQARMFDTPGAPWHAVSKSTLEDIKNIEPATPCCRPHHVDASGETPCPKCACTAGVFASGSAVENPRENPDLKQCVPPHVAIRDAHAIGASFYLGRRHRSSRSRRPAETNARRGRRWTTRRRVRVKSSGFKV